MKCRLPIRIGGGGGSAAPTPVSVTITGTGNTTYCYATIGGTNRYGAGTYEVMPGDKITFGVYGRSSSYYGRVTIDGQQVLNVSNQTTQTYEWTVPDDISAISMQMTYTSSTYTRNGRIVVATSKKPTGGGDSGGDSGGGASEYAVTVVDGLGVSGAFEWILGEGASVSIGNVAIIGAGTYTAHSGELLTIYSSGGWESHKITVNGTVVKTGSNEDLTYSHTITATTTLTLRWDGNDSKISWDITTE